MRLFFIALLCLASAASAFSQRIATLPDGSKVVLKKDGTWEPFKEPVKNPEKMKPSTLGSMRSVKTDDPVEVCKTVDAMKYQFQKFEFENEREYLDRMQRLTVETLIKSTKHNLADAIYVFRDVAEYDAERQSFDFVVKNLVPVSRIPCTIEVIERNYHWIPALKMASDKAQRIKASLVVAVYGYPTDLELYRKKGTLMIVPRRFVVFNQSTGEIYSETVVPDRSGVSTPYVGALF